MLIDDFRDATDKSVLGERWELFTDQVMGGVSTATMRRQILAGKRCQRMEADVSTKNNGGFAQMSLKLRQLDARKYRGIRMLVYGNDETYSLHLRTWQTPLPWQYYSAEFKAPKRWETVDIPFTSLKPAGIDVSKLGRLAIVAIKKDFHADIAIARLELY